MQQISKNPVIIMELCSGGSLYSILDDPRNSHGIEEEELKRVLGDVCKMTSRFYEKTKKKPNCVPIKITSCFPKILITTSCYCASARYFFSQTFWNLKYSNNANMPVTCKNDLWLYFHTENFTQNCTNIAL